MRPRGAAASAAVSLAGAAALTALSIARLPPPTAWLHAPATPFDRSEARSARNPFLLLQKAASVVPAGASVVMRTEPPDAVVDTSLFPSAVALLPGRRVLPAALWGSPRPELERQAEFVVLLGSLPRARPGRLLLATPEGTVWQRPR